MITRHSYIDCTTEIHNNLLWIVLHWKNLTLWGPLLWWKFLARNIIKIPRQLSKWDQRYIYQRCHIQVQGNPPHLMVTVVYCLRLTEASWFTFDSRSTSPQWFDPWYCSVFQWLLGFGSRNLVSALVVID